MRARKVILLCAVLIGAATVSARAESLSEVFKKVNPSVVVILTQEKEITPATGTRLVSVEGLGSGVLVSADGRVLTAAHVVQTADAVAVKFLDGETLGASVVYSEPAADVALLQLQRAPRAPEVARLGDSDTVNVGDQVFVVGAPLGIGHTLTVGHVSGRRGPDVGPGDMRMAEYFQTDAAISPGNSGGPLFNMSGDVVGIVSHILSRSGGSEGLGFAITSNVARHLLLEEKSLWSGLSGTLLSGDLARVLNIPPPGAGLLIEKIAGGSPAERFGLRAGTLRAMIGDDDLILGGDIVLAVQGISLGDANGYVLVRRTLSEARAGESVTVTILRSGTTLNLTGKVER
jgi:S1-C subfamily serine protease